MNLQRLKFAWARGARIQQSWLYQGKKHWVPANPDDPWPVDKLLYRIHPDDEHLQYGPVSNALRDMSLYEDWPKEEPFPQSLFQDLAGSNHYLVQSGYFDFDPKDRYMLLDFTRLFFAELLADEGL